jgi:predicted GNAT family N-acyltransferase
MDPGTAAPAASLVVRAADFAADYAAIRSVRFAVFVDEQRVPADLELDDRDPLCRHLLAYLDATPVATGRIDLHDGKIGRVAVLAAYRRTGAGRAIMEGLHARARAAGLDRVWCHAQISATPFYERLGYLAVGERFDEAGIEHVKMQRTL